MGYLPNIGSYHAPRLIKFSYNRTTSNNTLRNIIIIVPDSM